MFKITLGALIGTLAAAFIPTRRMRLMLAGFVFLLFVVIEVIFIAHGGD
jgi:hypothetical protein